MTKMLIIMPLAAALLAGCVVTAPVSVSSEYPDTIGNILPKEFHILPL